MADPSPEVVEAVTVARNRRTDAMFVCAFGIIVWLVWLVAYKTDLSQFAQSVVNIVLGMFLRELGSMYSYENGGTRSGQAKDATIKSLAEAAPIATAAAVAASVSAGGQMQSPIKAENVAIDANTAVVNSGEPK